MDIKTLHDEHELMVSIARGDERAFRLIYDRYYHKLYAFVLSVLKSDLLTEEVIQEVFLKFWKQGSALIDIQNVESYLVTIARNRSYDELRRNKLRHFESLEEVDRHTKGDNQTEDAILLNDARKLINAAVAKLPSQQRRVYQLCHMRGYKYEEAARELNLSVATVQSYMKLALRNLRSQLGNYPDLVILLIILKIF